MAIYDVPVIVRIEAKSATAAAQKVLAFMEYAQDFGNDDGAVQGSLVGLRTEVKKEP